MWKNMVDLADLMNNRRFLEVLTKVLRTKDEVTRVIRKNVQEVLRIMNIPSQKDLLKYAARVRNLEKELDRVLAKTKKGQHKKKHK